MNAVERSEGVYLYDILDFYLCEISFYASHRVESTGLLVGWVTGSMMSEATQGFDQSQSSIQWL